MGSFPRLTVLALCFAALGGLRTVLADGPPSDSPPNSCPTRSCHGYGQSRCDPPAFYSPCALLDAGAGAPLRPSLRSENQCLRSGSPSGGAAQLTTRCPTAALPSTPRRLFSCRPRRRRRRWFIERGGKQVVPLLPGRLRFSATLSRKRPGFAHFPARRRDNGVTIKNAQKAACLTLDPSAAEEPAWRDMLLPVGCDRFWS